MSPKIEPTPEEIAAETAERERVDATILGTIARATYEAAMSRSGLSAKTIEGKWAELPTNLRVQWLEGAAIALRIVGDDLGARAAAAVILGATPDFEAIDRFLDFYGDDA